MKNKTKENLIYIKGYKNASEYINNSELKHHYTMTPKLLKEVVKQGRIFPSFCLTKKVKFKKSDLDHYLEETQSR